MVYSVEEMTPAQAVAFGKTLPLAESIGFAAEVEARRGSEPWFDEYLALVWAE